MAYGYPYQPGGMLTNFKTIRGRVARLAQLKKMQEDGTFDLLPKKEVAGLELEIEKLEKYLGGITEMKKIPEAMFIVDPRKEKRLLFPLVNGLTKKESHSGTSEKEISLLSLKVQEKKRP